MENVALEVLKFNSSLSESEAVLWPCFVGETGTGKTARAQTLAKSLSLPLSTLLLGTMMPEDISGLPRVVGKTADWILPSWAMLETSTLVLLDEIDKAKPDHWATILTLLTSRRLRDKSVNASFLAACQPSDRQLWLSDETGKALSARLIFLPIYSDAQWIAQKHNVQAPNFLSARRELELPVLDEPSPRQLDWLVGFARKCSSKEVLKAVVQGIVMPALVPEVLAWLSNNKLELTSQSLIEVLNEDPERVEKLTSAELMLLYPQLWTQRNLNLGVLERTLARVLEVVSPDEMVELQKKLISNVTAQTPDSDGSFDLLEPHSGQEVFNSLVAGVERGKALREARELGDSK